MGGRRRTMHLNSIQPESGQEQFKFVVSAVFIVEVGVSGLHEATKRCSLFAFEGNEI